MKIKKITAFLSCIIASTLLCCCAVPGSVKNNTEKTGADRSNGSVSNSGDASRNADNIFGDTDDSRSGNGLEKQKYYDLGQGIKGAYMGTYNNSDYLMIQNKNTSPVHVELTLARRKKDSGEKYKDVTIKERYIEPDGKRIEEIKNLDSTGVWDLKTPIKLNISNADATNFRGEKYCVPDTKISLEKGVPGSGQKNYIVQIENTGDKNIRFNSRMYIMFENKDYEIQLIKPLDENEYNGKILKPGYAGEVKTYIKDGEVPKDEELKIAEFLYTGNFSEADMN